MLRPRDEAVHRDHADAGPGTFWCGGADCPPGWVCCLSAGRCFEPAQRDTACPTPSRESDPRACASRLDCSPDEICAQPDQYCTGPGRCRSASLCVEGSGPVCGCDGRDYASICAAERAGVRVSRAAMLGRQHPEGARCGEIVRTSPPAVSCLDATGRCTEGETCVAEIDRCIYGTPFVTCGSDAHCGDGQRCCTLTGTCMDAACEDCCRAPEVGFFPCREQVDCLPFGGKCAGYGCDGTIGCVEGRDCGGELEPVCLCDGRTYTSECQALSEGLRIASEGECAP